MANDLASKFDTDEDEPSEIEYYCFPDADAVGIQDPYFAKIWQNAVDELNTQDNDNDDPDMDDMEDWQNDDDSDNSDLDDSDDENFSDEEDFDDEDESDWDEEDEAQFEELFSPSLQFDENRSDLQKLRDFLEQGRQAAVKQVAATARRLRGLKNLNVDLGSLAGIVEQEIRGLRPLLEEQLISNMFGGAALGVAQAGVHVPPAFTTPFAMDPALNTEALASLLFPGATPPKAVFPVLEAAVSTIKNAAVAAGKDFRHTAQLVREEAFAITGDLTEKALLDVRNEFQRAVAEGLSQKEFIDIISDKLENAGSPLAPAHLENVFRTNVMSAMSDAQNEAIQNPMIADAFPYAAYSATHDGRVRQEHLALEGHGLDGTNIYRVNDPVFQKFRPPWAFNCRCTWTPTSIEMAAHKGVQEAADWMQRASEMVQQHGGTLHQYLNDTAPAASQHVSEPGFQPDPEFDRSPQFTEQRQNRGLIVLEGGVSVTSKQSPPQITRASSISAPSRPMASATSFEEVVGGLMETLGASIGVPLGEAMVNGMRGIVREELQQLQVHVAAPTIQLAEQQSPTVIVNVPEQAPPTVNVAAPIVNVAAPVVNVAAPDVHVEVNAPKQSSSKEIAIERNAEGSIIGAKVISK